MSPTQIIDDINNVKKSPIFGYEVDFTKFLGGKRLNESGAVVGATAIRNIWYTVRDRKWILKNGILTAGKFEI